MSQTHHITGVAWGVDFIYICENTVVALESNQGLAYHKLSCLTNSVDAALSLRPLSVNVLLTMSSFCNVGLCLQV